LISETASMMPPWYSSDTVGMLTSRPSEAFSSQSSLSFKASSALG
jgi:hypothetical protein